MLTDEANFVGDVALMLFAISLTFSMDLSYRELKIFPTLFLCRWWRRRFDMKGLASFTSVMLNIASLLVLGAFWCALRFWLVSETPVGPALFIVYLVLGAGVGVLPWFIYWLMHWMLFLLCPACEAVLVAVGLVASKTTVYSCRSCGSWYNSSQEKIAAPF